MGNKRAARQSAKKKKRRSLVRSIMLLLFCAALLFGAWYFFLGGRTTEDILPEAEEESEEETPEPEVEEPDVVVEEMEGEPEAESDVPVENALTGETALQEITNGDNLLALVTKETTLKSSYAPSDLERIPEYMYPARELWLREEALRQLEALWQAAYDEGVTLTIISAYRSYAYQQTLFANYAAIHGSEAANRFSARAGQSEHQLGTTVDFGGTSVDLKAAYAETNQGRWLADHAYKYGFAMSYPEGQEAVTGYIFEPWHYRYIGVGAAAEWFSSGLSLKEFLQTKPQDFE